MGDEAKTPLELKPCPFCGGEGKINTYPDANTSEMSLAQCAGGPFPKFLTGTTGCGAMIERANPIQAAEAWNARI
jgi:Restriction alleviation protein Lar